MLLTRWCTPCSTALCSSSTTTWLVTVSSVGCLLLGWSRLRCLRGLRAVLRLPSGLLPRALLREGGAPVCASQPCGGLGALRLRALAFRRRGWPLPLWLAACYLVDADFGVSGDYLLSLDFFQETFYHELYYTEVCGVLLCFSICGVPRALRRCAPALRRCVWSLRCSSLRTTWLTPTSVSPWTTCCHHELYYTRVWLLAVLLNLWWAPCSPASSSCSTTPWLVAASSSTWRAAAAALGGAAALPGLSSFVKVS